jgi:hypothetical protein
MASALFGTRIAVFAWEEKVMPVEMTCGGVDRIGTCVDEIRVDRTIDVWEDDQSIVRFEESPLLYGSRLDGEDIILAPSTFRPCNFGKDTAAVTAVVVMVIVFRHGVSDKEALAGHENQRLVPVLLLI